MKLGPLLVGVLSILALLGSVVCPRGGQGNVRLAPIRAIHPIPQQPQTQEGNLQIGGGSMTIGSRPQNNFRITTQRQQTNGNGVPAQRSTTTGRRATVVAPSNNRAGNDQASTTATTFRVSGPRPVNPNPNVNGGVSTTGARGRTITTGGAGRGRGISTGVTNGVQNNLATTTTTTSNMRSSQGLKRGASQVIKAGSQTSGAGGRTYAVPSATYGYELEGYSQGIFDYLTPKRKVENWPVWNSGQRAEYFLTQKHPQYRSAPDMIQLKKAIEKDQELKIMDYGENFIINKERANSPSKDWYRVYSEHDSHEVMWEVVSDPISNLDGALSSLVNTMRGTRNEDWRRVQINVYLEKSLVPNNEKLVALTASANFALALYSRDTAVLHSNNEFPSKGAMSDLLKLVKTSPMNLNDNFKYRLMAIRETPKSKNHFRFEFRVLSSENFARCMISAFLEAAADSSTYIPTFGHCFTKNDCSQVSKVQGYDSIQPLTTDQVKNWMLKDFPISSHTVQGGGSYDIDFIEDVAKKHPSWSSQTAIVSAISSGKMRQSIKCFLAQADKKP